jgi:cytochrome c1
MIRLGALAVGLLFVVNVLWGAIAPREAASPDMTKELHKHPKHMEWAHNGPGNLGVFGTFDRAQLQRGFQVYKEVCSACHSMNYIAFRNLVGVTHTEEEAKTIAAEYEYKDGPNDKGEYFMRSGKVDIFTGGMTLTGLLFLLILQYFHLYVASLCTNYTLIYKEILYFLEKFDFVYFWVAPLRKELMLSYQYNTVF